MLGHGKCVALIVLANALVFNHGFYIHQRATYQISKVKRCHRPNKISGIFTSAQAIKPSIKQYISSIPYSVKLSAQIATRRDKKPNTWNSMH